MFKNYKISPDERKLFAKTDSNDLYKNNLKGEVKTVISKQIKQLNKSPIPHKQLLEVSKFNQKGEILSYKEEYKGNIQLLRKEYLYNEKDQLIKELIYDEEDEIIETVSFKHNIQGQMIEEFREDYDLFLRATYDENGLLNKVKEQSCDEKTYVIKRDENNPENISIIETIYDDNTTSKSYYDYNSLGNPIKVLHYDKNDNLMSSEEIQYDNNNNISKLNNKTERRSTEFTYEYEYDNLKNWMNFKFYVNGEFKQESQREIQYY